MTPPAADDQDDESRATEVELVTLGWRRTHLADPLAQARLGAVLQRQVVEEAAEVLGQVAGAGVAAGGVGVEALGDDRVEAPGDRRVDAPERGRLAALGDHRSG